MLAPVVANGLLAFSIQYEILWGYAVYMVLLLFTVGGIGLASKLPRTPNTIVIEESDA
jgi:predicted cobalt transporter CbtA